MKKYFFILGYILGSIFALNSYIFPILGIKLFKVGVFQLSSIGIAILGIVLLAEHYTGSLTDKIFKHWAENIGGIFLILLAATDLIPFPQRAIVEILLVALLIGALIFKKSKLQKEVDESWKKVQIGDKKRKKL